MKSTLVVVQEWIDKTDDLLFDAIGLTLAESHFGGVSPRLVKNWTPEEYVKHAVEHARWLESMDRKYHLLEWSEVEISETEWVLWGY